MRFWIYVILAVWPNFILAQWIQVGFSEISTADSPDKVTVEDESGIWQRELELRERYDVKLECVVSEPLVLPRHNAEGTFAVHWEQGGMAFSYQFKPIVGKPLQILLDSPALPTKKSGPTVKLEPVLYLAPNPFNPTTTVSLSLPEASHLRLEVFDILGRSITLLADENRPSGTHQWLVDGSNWASGTYFLSYRLSPGQSGVRRMVLLK